MKKPFYSLCLALAATALLGGCELYFGGDDNDDGGDRWTYCANDGYYVCNGDECSWAGAQCPGDPNYTCEADGDCAAGCYCSDAGVCEEAGFCNNDSQCPEGYTCDEERSSCVPEACASDADCEPGEYCDTETGSCIASCACTTDQEAIDQGWGFCDEARGTCEPTPVTGSCQGVGAQCTLAEPTCAAGQVPLVADGCWTGNCETITACDLEPECEKLQHETDCLGRVAACTSVYYGINCQRADGSACMAGDTGCVCQSFQFADCRSRNSNRTFTYEGPNGELIDMFSN